MHRPVWYRRKKMMTEYETHGGKCWGYRLDLISKDNRTRGNMTHELNEYEITIYQVRRRTKIRNNK